MTTLVYGSIDYWRVVRVVNDSVSQNRDLVFTPSMPAIFLGEAAPESDDSDTTP